MTLRRQIIRILETGPVTLREIANALGVREREILDHLPHVSRTVGPSRRIAISPAQCLGCGFTFRKRTRFSTPSRCPKCRHQRIQPPEFSLAQTLKSKG